MTTRILICLLPCMFLLGCTNESRTTKTATADTLVNKPVPAAEVFSKGEVIPIIRLRNDTSQSFALYLPKNHTDSIRYPVIVFFDPHAEGFLPLHLYRDLADQYGFVLLGSNNSKNGMDAASAMAVGNNLVAEAANRFHTDQSRIALCGFSGGAKVALITGAGNPLVSCVVYCGAATEIDPSHPMKLLGFAGTRDMNYTDVVSFDWSLTTTPVKHAMVEWSGKHEFPSASVFEDAFVFLTDGDFVHDKKKEVTITPEKVREEQGYKQRYIAALQNPDLNWWKNEIKTLNAKKKTNLMDERLLGFISLACYSITVNALQQKDLAFAEKILTIYKLADPKNKACGELQAELNRKKKA